MYNFTFNNQSSADFPAFVVNRPNIPTAAENVKTFNVAGRNGSLIIKEGTYPDITISIDLVYNAEADQFAETFRNLKAWLLGNVDNKLSFSDDVGFFYVVKKVVISDNKRTKRYIGKFTVKFTCEAYQYAFSGNNFLGVANVAHNPYDLCHPVYQIVGEGVCTLTVNGKVFTVNVGQNAVIDTDKMLTYRTDGTLQNTIVKGDYADLHLKSGDNTITVTEGFNLAVKPRWGRI